MLTKRSWALPAVALWFHQFTENYESRLRVTSVSGLHPWRPECGFVERVEAKPL